MFAGMSFGTLVRPIKIKRKKTKDLLRKKKKRKIILIKTDTKCSIASNKPFILNDSCEILYTIYWHTYTLFFIMGMCKAAHFCGLPERLVDKLVLRKLCYYIPDQMRFLDVFLHSKTARRSTVGLNRTQASWDACLKESVFILYHFIIFFICFAYLWKFAFATGKKNKIR